MNQPSPLGATPPSPTSSCVSSTLSTTGCPPPCLGDPQGIRPGAAKGRSMRPSAKLSICLAAAMAAGAPAAAARTLGERSLKKGDKGGDVVTLQRVLTMKGYRLGPVDGIFGRMTK